MLGAPNLRMQQVMSRRRALAPATYRLHKAGSIDPNARDFERRAKVFATAATGSGAATLLVTRRGGAISVYAVLAGHGAQQAVGHLTTAVAGRAELVDFPTEALDTASVGYLDVAANSLPTRDSKFDNSPGEVALSLARSMPEGSWVAVPLRRPAKSEARRWRPWLGHATGQGALPVHHSVSTEAVVVSLLAGSDDRDTTRTLLAQVASALPGFDLSVTPRTVSRAGLLRPPLVKAALCLASALLVRLLLGAPEGTIDYQALAAGKPAPQVVAAVAADLARRLLPPLLLMAGAVFGLVAVGRWRGLAAGWSNRVLGARAGVVPAPPHRSGRPRAPKPEQQQDGHLIPAFGGDYPLHPAAFLVGPEVVVGIAAPQGGVAYGEDSAADHATPPAVLSDHGPHIGDTAEGAVHLCAADMRHGVAVTGAPGTGKTKLLDAFYGWSCAERVAPSGRPGFPGRNNTLINFDAKGDEIPHLVAWAQAAGDDPVVVELANPATLGIDLFATPGDASARAGTFVNAMVYAFDRGDIQGRSFEVLHAAFTAALAWDVTECGTIDGLPAHPNPVELAHAVCGGFGDRIAADVWGAVSTTALRLASTHPDHARTADLNAARRALTPIFEGTTPAARRTHTEAARNKIKSLLDVPAWWAVDRRRHTWDDLVVSHANIIVNLGAATLGHGTTALVDERVSRQLSSMLFFTLDNTIKRLCAGWEKQQRWVSIFSDELATQAVHSGAVIEWLRDKGRSYGVRLFLATQRPAQLAASVQTAFLTLQTLVSLRQEETSAAASVAEQLGASASDWSPADITSLRPWHAAVRTFVNGVRQPPFVVSVPDFSRDPTAAFTDWGYTIPSIPAPVAETGSRTSVQHQAEPHTDLNPPTDPPIGPAIDHDGWDLTSEEEFANSHAQSAEHMSPSDHGPWGWDVAAQRHPPVSDPDPTTGELEDW